MTHPLQHWLDETMTITDQEILTHIMEANEAGDVMLEESEIPYGNMPDITPTMWLAVGKTLLGIAAGVGVLELSEQDEAAVLAGVVAVLPALISIVMLVADWKNRANRHASLQ